MSSARKCSFSAPFEGASGYPLRHSEIRHLRSTCHREDNDRDQMMTMMEALKIILSDKCY
jgi:hypothetical protein